MDQVVGRARVIGIGVEDRLHGGGRTHVGREIAHAVAAAEDRERVERMSSGYAFCSRSIERMYA